MKMDVDVALIMTVGGIAGAILTTQLWQMNWFKRENFKIQKSNVMAQNKLTLKKLEKEMNLTHGKSVTENLEKPSLAAKIPDLLQLLTKLSPEIQERLIDEFIGGGYIDKIPEALEGGGGGWDMLLDFAEQNPDIVSGLLKGILEGSSKLKGGLSGQATQDNDYQV